MRPPDAIAILAQNPSRTCSCGAATERPWSLCRKCSSRSAWNRKAASKKRGTARQIAKRQARDGFKFLAAALLLIPAANRSHEGS